MLLGSCCSIFSLLSTVMFSMIFQLNNVWKNNGLDKSRQAKIQVVIIVEKFGFR